MRLTQSKNRLDLELFIKSWLTCCTHLYFSFCKISMQVKIITSIYYLLQYMYNKIYLDRNKKYKWLWNYHYKNLKFQFLKSVAKFKNFRQSYEKKKRNEI